MNLIRQWIKRQWFTRIRLCSKGYVISFLNEPCILLEKKWCLRFTENQSLLRRMSCLPFSYCSTNCTALLQIFVRSSMSIEPFINKLPVLVSFSPPTFRNICSVPNKQSVFNKVHIRTWHIMNVGKDALHFLLYLRFVI